MSHTPEIGFSNAALPKKGTIVVFCDNENRFGAGIESWPVHEALKKAMDAAEFKGRFGQVLDVLTPAGSEFDRVLVVGLGEVSKLVEFSWLRLGGKVWGKISKSARATVCLELPSEGKVDASQSADFALGMKLSAYRFNIYKTKENKKKTKKAPVAQFTVAELESIWSNCHSSVVLVNAKKESESMWHQ